MQRPDGIDFNVHVQQAWNDIYDNYGHRNSSGYNLRNTATLVKKGNISYD